jgi:GNAT superfamily N-acetyltransferase
MRSALVTIGPGNFDALACCGIKAPSHPGRCAKRCWLEAHARFGLHARELFAPGGHAAGYLETIPGEFAWRAVEAPGYLFIHCIWIHAKAYQGKGWGGAMLDACLEDARAAGLRGVAVLARDGPFLAGSRLFLAHGFEPADAAPPDYQLLARRLDPSAPLPHFPGGWEERAAHYGRGLAIVKSDQCPYIAKFAAEIAETARAEYGIEPRVVELQSARDARNAPTPYAVFSLIYNGRVIADHQISRTRFRNLMRSLR